MKFTALLISLLFFMLSCQQKGSNQNEISLYTTKGDSLSTISQSVLLKNVAKAIEKGGTKYAVEFCNLKAIPLTDSLSAINHIKIERITDRNRNPNNILKTSSDKVVFASFKTNKKRTDTLLVENKEYVYYKRINTAMPTCIKCHGNPQLDIEENTLQTINTKYPKDKATGYALNDFRGLWKITFPFDSK